jgi:hypothetical protein
LSSVLLTQVKFQKTGSRSVQDALYYRSRAESYFKLARLMSLRSDAETFRAEAEQCLRRVVELERAVATTSTPSATN